MTPEQFLFYLAGFIEGKVTIDEEGTENLKVVSDAICNRIVAAKTPKIRLQGVE